MNVEISLVWMTNDHVKSLGNVNRHGQRVVGGTGLVETPGYSKCVVGMEAILGG